jgi:hypothetical protein
MYGATILLAALTLAQAEVEPTPPAPTTEASSAEPAEPQEDPSTLLEEGRGAAQRLERIRGLRFLAVPPVVRGGDELRKESAARRVSAACPPVSLAARGRAWADLGLGSGDSPRRFLENLAGDLRGIAFDADGPRVLVDPSLLTPEDFAPKEGPDAASSVLLATGVRPDEPALAHVLMHALQRSRSGADPMGGTTDATLAASAWAEGEASLVAVLYLFEGLGVQGEVLGSALDPGELLGGTLVPESLDRLPGVEGTLMDFVYREGYAQAVLAYRAAGFKGVDRGMAVRRTTRDVLHGDRKPLVPSAIPEPVAPKGSLLADRDSIGEEGIIVLVSTLTGKDNLGLMAGDGWAGDALFRFEPVDAKIAGEGLTVWETRWISDEEAADFQYGLERSLTQRFIGVAFASLADGERRLAAGGRSFRLLRKGVQVTLRIAPEAADSPKSTVAPARRSNRHKSSKSK